MFLHRININFFHLDDTGYSSQLLSGSLLSLRQSRESIDSQENEDDTENLKPTTTSSPISEIKKETNESVNLIKKKEFFQNNLIYFIFRKIIKQKKFVRHLQIIKN